MPSVSRGALWTVYLVMLMDTLNFGIVFPLLPSIAKEFGASATAVGSMATTYSLCQMVATPILGRLSDRIGRRPVLLFSLLGTMLSSVGTGFAWNFYLLVAARCVNGFSGGTIGVVNAYIADVTTTEEKSVYMSYVSAANSIGIIVGPAVGGMLSHWGFSTACFVSGGLSALNLLVALPTLKESRWQQAREISASLPANDHTGDGAIPAEEESASAPATIPCAAGYLFFAGFFLALGFAAIESIVAYYLMDTFFHGDEKKSGQFYGVSFMCCGIVMFIFAGFVYKPARRIFGERPLVLFGTLLRTAGFIFQSLAPTKILFVISMLTCVSGNQFIFPSTSSLLTTMCHKSIYGRALGYSQGLQSLSRVIAPSVFGFAYDDLTHEFSFYACAATSLLAGALIMCAYGSHSSAEQGPSGAEVLANAERHQDSTALEGAVGDVSPNSRRNACRNSEDASAKIDMQRQLSGGRGHDASLAARPVSQTAPKEDGLA